MCSNPMLSCRFLRSTRFVVSVCQTKGTTRGSPLCAGAGHSATPAGKWRGSAGRPSPMSATTTLGGRPSADPYTFTVTDRKVGLACFAYTGFLPRQDEGSSPPGSWEQNARTVHVIFCLQCIHTMVALSSAKYHPPSCGGIGRCMSQACRRSCLHSSLVT